MREAGLRCNRYNVRSLLSSIAHTTKERKTYNTYIAICAQSPPCKQQTNNTHTHRERERERRREKEREGEKRRVSGSEKDHRRR